MYRGGRKQNFGSKQPTKAVQLAALKSLICGCGNLDALPDLSSLASMYRMDRREVECLVGAERRRRSETGAVA